MATGWRQLGDEIIARRAQLGYRSRPAFAAASGLSKRLLDDLETGARANYRPETITALEYALGWQPGSAERIRRGRRPIIDVDTHMAALRLVWPRVPIEVREILVDQARRAAR